MLQPPEEENIMVANPYEKVGACPLITIKFSGVILAYLSTG